MLAVVLRLPWVQVLKPEQCEEKIRTATLAPSLFSLFVSTAASAAEYRAPFLQRGGHSTSGTLKSL